MPKVSRFLECFVGEMPKLPKIIKGLEERRGFGLVGVMEYWA
jgi:hypothetical protein